ncbi:MAG: hypothetical protein CM15mV105_240 [uncultured marine virus]|nr:MAG: hypothetical protein CM15mV105_240 [uncultured marine virus]
MFKLNKEFSPKGTGQAGYDKFFKGKSMPPLLVKTNI